MSKGAEQQGLCKPMTEQERRQEATDLTIKAYSQDGKMLSEVIDSLSDMCKKDRVDVINKMRAIDKEVHKPENKQEGINLPHLVITDRESKNGSQLGIKTVVLKQNDVPEAKKK